MFRFTRYLKPSTLRSTLDPRPFCNYPADAAAAAAARVCISCANATADCEPPPASVTSVASPVPNPLSGSCHRRSPVFRIQGENLAAAGREQSVIVTNDIHDGGRRPVLRRQGRTPHLGARLAVKRQDRMLDADVDQGTPGACHRCGGEGLRVQAGGVSRNMTGFGSSARATEGVTKALLQSRFCPAHESIVCRKRVEPAEESLGAGRNSGDGELA